MNILTHPPPPVLGRRRVRLSIDFQPLDATVTLCVFCFLVIVTAVTVTVVALKVDIAFINLIGIDEHNVIDRLICNLSRSAYFSGV